MYKSVPAGTLKITWELVGQKGMSSTIRYVVTAETWFGNYSFDSNVNVYASFKDSNNKTKTHSFWGVNSYGLNAFTAGQQLATGTFDIPRDTVSNQGSFDIVAWFGSGYEKDSNGTSTWIVGSEVRKSWTVDTLTVSGTGAQITAISDFTDETGPTITYSYDRGTGVDSVTIQAAISFTGATDNIPYRTISSTETTYTFNFTDAEKETLHTLLKSGTTASVRFLMKTTEVVNGETLETVSSFTKAFNFVNYTPLIQPTVWDTNPTTIALTGNANHIIRYMSNVNYDMNVELRKGGLDIIGCYVSNSGRMVEGFTSGNYGAATSNMFYFSATDDRGYTGTASLSLSNFYGEFIDYIKLTNGLKASSITADGKLAVTITGKYFNANFGVAQNQMTLSYKAYPKDGSGSWSSPTAITPVMTDNTTYSYSFDIAGLDYTKQYVLEVKVSDLLMSAESSTSVVARPIFYWNNDEFIFNVPVTFNGGTLDSTIEEGSITGYYMNASGAPTKGAYTWHYRKWSSGLLECWCTIAISTKVNVSWGNLYVANPLYTTDLCYPMEIIDLPVITATLGAGGTKGMLIADNSYLADTISTGRYNIASPISITNSAAFRINYYVKGKWK